MDYSCKKYFLTFHTIFLPDENIKWLEEFLKYYIHIGFEQFYLYDNTGSIGRNGSTATKNKYGYKIIQDPCNELILNNILKKYEKYITYIKWQPKNEKGQIIYGQELSIKHYKDNYGQDTVFCAFMDLDEFLFSEKNINIREYLKSQIDRNISCIQLYQKKFKERHDIKTNLITQNYECINPINLPYRKDYGIKNIVLVDKFDGGCPLNGGGIHNIYVSGKKEFADPTILRFNHYNVNKKQLWFINKKYHTELTSLPDIDDSMKRYADIFNN